MFATRPTLKRVALATTRSSRSYLRSRQSRNMATATHVSLDPAATSGFQLPSIKSESTKIANQLLQENHDEHHVFFNNDGFHNHIVHHLLAIWAMEATPEELQQAYDDNKNYQRSMMPAHESNIEDMSDKHKFRQFLGQEKYYRDYMVFFEKQIESRGWQEVLQEYVFSGDLLAEDIFVRSFAGFLHPLIHLGYGIEFAQPAIIAEALAQTCIHDIGPRRYVHKTNELGSTTQKSKNLVELLDEARANETLRNSPHWDDGNKLRDGVFKRAMDQMVDVASQWHVTTEDLEKKTAEMINVGAFFAGASQRPDKHVKFDFFYMHSVNCSIFFMPFLRQEWLSAENKKRLVEIKGRYDLANYVSRGSPELKVETIRNYKPKQPKDGWKEIMKRVDEFRDDGHASKLIRALANGEQVCKPYENDDAFPVKADMWLQIAHMVIDSVEIEGDTWIRNAGFDQAWEKVQSRPKL